MAMFGLMIGTGVLAWWLTALVSAWQTTFGGVSEKDATPLPVLWVACWLGLNGLLLVLRAVW